MTGDEAGGSVMARLLKKKITEIDRKSIIFFGDCHVYIESVDLKKYEKSLAVLCISPRARKVFKLCFSWICFIIQIAV